MACQYFKNQTLFNKKAIQLKNFLFQFYIAGAQVEKLEKTLYERDARLLLFTASKDLPIMCRNSNGGLLSIFMNFLI